MQRNQESYSGREIRKSCAFACMLVCSWSLPTSIVTSTRDAAPMMRPVTTGYNMNPMNSMNPMSPLLSQAPPLRSTMPQTLPRNVYKPTVSSYTPTARKRVPSVQVPRSEVEVSSSPNSTMLSKYSAARVKQRISDDGTVAPVSEPKMTKDGLYQRPAGRTRKGMEWDAVVGKWVPSTRGN